MDDFMIDENLRQAVQNFNQTGHVSLDEISEDFRPGRLPKDPMEALAVFRYAMHRNIFHSCAAAVERIEMSYRLGKLRYFYEEQISKDENFWWALEEGVRKILSRSFLFLSEEFSPLINYVEKGVLFNGVAKKRPSQYERGMLPDFGRAVRSLYNSRDEVATYSEYFTERARVGAPPFDEDETPENIGNAREVFKEILSEIALNYGDCAALEETSIRTVMAYAHFLDRHRDMFSVVKTSRQSGAISAVAAFQLSVRQHMVRAGEYEASKGFLEFKSIECGSLGRRRLLPA